jgi:acetyl esterase/lipase
MPATSRPGRRIAWHTTRVRVPGHPVDVPVRVLEPSGPRTGWLVWAHGGSWRSGSAQAWHHPCAELAATSGATVLSVDYRLAPGHRHPAALLDVLAVLTWAVQLAGGDAAAVAVGGDSAGATIAACAAVAVRDRGGALAGQVLAYPPIDPACRADSYRRDPDAFPQPATLATAWHAYRGPGPDISAGLRSTPAEEPDLTGVAPAVLAVGTLDPVLDDVRDYRRRLTDAGVPVRYHELPDTAHGAFLAPEPRLRDFLGRTVSGLFRQGR